jgi:hypothetical protein
MQFGLRIGDDFLKDTDVFSESLPTFAGELT